MVECAAMSNGIPEQTAGPDAAHPAPRGAPWGATVDGMPVDHLHRHLHAPTGQVMASPIRHRNSKTSRPPTQRTDGWRHVCNRRPSLRPLDYTRWVLAQRAMDGCNSLLQYLCQSANNILQVHGSPTYTETASLRGLGRFLIAFESCMRVCDHPITYTIPDAERLMNVDPS